MHRRLACLLKSYVEPHSTSSIVARVAKQRRTRVATVNVPHVTALAMKPLTLVASKSPKPCGKPAKLHIVLYACSITYGYILTFCSDVQFCLVMKSVYAGSNLKRPFARSGPSILYSVPCVRIVQRAYLRLQCASPWIYCWV